MRTCNIMSISAMKIKGYEMVPTTYLYLAGHLWNAPVLGSGVLACRLLAAWYTHQSGLLAGATPKQRLVSIASRAVAAESGRHKDVS